MDAHFGAKKKPKGLIPSQGALHATIYSSPDDRALGLASALFGSEMRLGQQDLYRADTKTLGHDPGRSGLVDFIQVNGKTDATGHGYFLSNPAVSSDLVALIRYGLEPGAPGRPLVEINRPYWRVASAAASSQ